MMRFRLTRFARTLLFTLAVAASLLTFPAGVPWMMAGWLAWYSWMVTREARQTGASLEAETLLQRALRRRTWLPLVLCAGMVLVKRVALLPGVMAMLGVMAAAAIVELVVQRKASAKHTAGIALRLATVWIAWAIMFYDWHTAAHASRRLALRPGDRVACLGDSLTSGLAPIGGYPKELAAIIEAEVLDFGHPGITSEEGLRHLPKLLSQRPRVVVIELGGHDFLKNVDRSVARSNLVTLITAIQQAGGEPILMEIPRGFMVDPYAGLERELTREYDLELISDTCIRKLVLYSPYAPPGLWTGGPHLSDDGLHPNAAGNRVLAEAVARALAFQPR